MEKPGAGVGPVALGGARGDAEGLGGFLGGETDEVFLFHELGLAGVVGGEGFEGVVEEEDFGAVGLGRGEIEAGGVGADAGEGAAVADGVFAAGVFDEDAVHGFGGGAEKVGAIRPRGLGIAAEAEPDLVHERGGLECLAGDLMGHLGGGGRFSPVNLWQDEGDVSRVHEGAGWGAEGSGGVAG